MNLSDTENLPTTLSTRQAAEIWGVGVDHLWRLAREHRAPVEPLRLGTALRWPTLAVLRSVAIDASREPASRAPLHLVLNRTAES